MTFKIIYVSVNIWRRCVEGLVLHDSRVIIVTYHKFMAFEENRSFSKLDIIICECMHKLMSILFVKFAHVFVYTAT